VNLEPGNHGAGGPVAGVETRAIKSRHRLQLRKAESAIGGTVRKVIHVMRVIVVPLITGNFPGRFDRRHAGPMTACGVCVYSDVIVPMKRAWRREWPAAAIRSRRGPECLGVRASWPPVVALVVMNERPAPRCKRGRYKSSLRPRPIRMSTVGYTCAYSLRVSRTPDRNTLRGRHCECSEAIRLAGFYRLSNGIY
jgi:hypothetical protein